MNIVLKVSLALAGISLVGLFAGIAYDIQDDFFIFAVLGVMIVSLIGMIIGLVLKKLGIGTPQQAPSAMQFEQTQAEPSSTEPISTAPVTPAEAPTNDPGSTATGAPAANGVTVSKNTITSLLSIIIVGVILFFSFNSCDGFLGGEEADGKNIKVIYVDENSVGFYPVCPKCGHVGDAYDVKLSPGEDFETYFPCENRQCQHLYEVTVERDD